MILISTTTNDTAYNNRVEMIGELGVNASSPPSNWGERTGFIKGGCVSEQANIDFNIDEWIKLSLGEVDNADSNINLALGTQVTGITNFDGTGFDNLDADRSRTVVMNANFTGATRSFDACNLIVELGVTASFDSGTTAINSTETITVWRDLVTDGELIIGDTESLLTVRCVMQI